MISEKWKGMSKEEQEAATRDGYKDLEDHHEMKHLSTRNIPIHVFHDARMTLEVLKKEVSLLCQYYLASFKSIIHRSTRFMPALALRLPCLLLAPRPLTLSGHTLSAPVIAPENSFISRLASLCPILQSALRHIVYREPKVSICSGSIPPTVIDSFLLGVVENYVQNLLKLKSDTAALILDRLHKLSV
jgi:hypothetical protein